MKVLDLEPESWFLLEEDGALFLDGNYNHSFIGYDWMIRLKPEEVAQYRQRGREYINWLAGDIQYSAPLLDASNSAYKDRRLSRAYSEKALEAIEQWKAKGSSLD